ncbi:hypothetical protein N7470_001160 [Penicillium chermesinum]|nr:hypothetical protein N7470_001160 [Penicillium chermesinum]
MEQVSRSDPVAKRCRGKFGGFECGDPKPPQAGIEGRSQSEPPTSQSTAPMGTSVPESARDAEFSGRAKVGPGGVSKDPTRKSRVLGGL